jgi:hypothetical protein
VGEIPDVVGPGLRVLFCGINPGTVSGELAQHFARPGNRFWKVLYGCGFTDRLLAPAEQWELIDYGIGITNLVAPLLAGGGRPGPVRAAGGSRPVGHNGRGPGACVGGGPSAFRPTGWPSGGPTRRSAVNPNGLGVRASGSSPTRAGSRPATSFQT